MLVKNLKFTQVKHSYKAEFELYTVTNYLALFLFGWLKNPWGLEKTHCVTYSECGDFWKYLDSGEDCDYRLSDYLTEEWSDWNEERDRADPKKDPIRLMILNNEEDARPS